MHCKSYSEKISKILSAAHKKFINFTLNFKNKMLSEISKNKRTVFGMYMTFMSLKILLYIFIRDHNMFS